MPKSTPRKGRGASFNPHPRYLGEIREVFDDGWTEADERLPPLSTTVTVKQARTIISRNHSPDVPFTASITLTGAVSTAVSTATPTRPTPIWIYRLSSILSTNSLSSLVERDLDLLASMAERDLVEVFVSITILDHALACHMEPRAAAPKRRIETLQRLNNAEIPTGVMFAPVIPMLNDSEMGEYLRLRAPQARALPVM